MPVDTKLVLQVLLTAGTKLCVAPHCAYILHEARLLDQHANIVMPQLHNKMCYPQTIAVRNTWQSFSLRELRVMIDMRGYDNVDATDTCDYKFSVESVSV